MSSVRLFPARVVRQDWARRTVTALAESVDESGIDLYGVSIDPAAYEESPVAVYVYRQSGDEESYVGVVCDISVQALADGRVRGHEAVHPQRVDALVWHHHQTAHGTPALVSLLHRAGGEFTRTLVDVQHTPPLLDFPGPAGLRQSVWRLGESSETHALTAELATAEFYIADGHHRVAAALEEWRMAGKPDDASLLCQVLPMDGLRLSSFHRRVSGPVDTRALLTLLAEDFRVRQTSRSAAPVAGSIGVYAGRHWFEARFVGARRPGAAGLDVAILQNTVLDRVARVATSGRTPVVEAVPATASVDELTLRCDIDGGALFTLAPPTYNAIVEVADGGEVMPPKATYFEPKPCAGIFLRP